MDNTANGKQVFRLLQRAALFTIIGLGRKSTMHLLYFLYFKQTYTPDFMRKRSKDEGYRLCVGVEAEFVQF